MSKFVKLLAVVLVVAASLDEASGLFRKHRKDGPIRCGEHTKYKQKPNLELSSAGEFPFLVQVKSQNSTKERKCAGALIEADSILTSEECYELTGNYQLALGSEVWGSKRVTAINGDQEVYYPANPKSPNYCKTGDGLHVIYLMEKLPYFVPKKRRQAGNGSIPINRICLGDEGEKLISKKVLAVGWRNNPSQNEKAIAKEVVIEKCGKKETSKGVICLKDSSNLDDWLLGSVLVRDNGKGAWELVGIYTSVDRQLKFIDVRKQLECEFK